ncbi:MAG: sensor histidine kinase, partial [Chloroflexia bacterium]|nr:sensor histidine kinase [Chloroflexia bacterium]
VGLALVVPAVAGQQGSGPQHPELAGDLARQVGITLHAAQLSDALQASRAQLVLAREEECRRIRRDLHDSLGPTLASLRLQLSALRHRVRHDPDAEHLIDELRADVRAATADIRRLVYNLRPPMLDEFGLVGALGHVAQTSDGLTRTLDVPETLPTLPAALEVAIYRIAAEALHNIVQHAHATHCTVKLAINEMSVTLTVIDNGCGLPATYLAGVGHHSMQERAAELSGHVAILPASSGGTCVRASFPLKVEHHA